MKGIKSGLSMGKRERKREKRDHLTSGEWTKHIDSSSFFCAGLKMLDYM